MSNEYNSPGDDIRRRLNDWQPPGPGASFEEVQKAERELDAMRPELAALPSMEERAANQDENDVLASMGLDPANNSMHWMHYSSARALADEVHRQTGLPRAAALKKILTGGNFPNQKALAAEMVEDARSVESERQPRDNRTTLQKRIEAVPYTVEGQEEMARIERELRAKNEKEAAKRRR